MHLEGGFADVDRYTHTVDGTSFLNGTWGTQRLFYLSWLLGGYGSLQLLLASAVCGSVLLTGWGARRAGRTAPVAAFGALMAVWLVVQNLGLRPQLFALPLFAAYATLAMTFRPTWRTGAVSCVMVAVWANLHGSFAIAPILSLCVAAGHAWEALDEANGAIGEKAGAAMASLTGGEARAHVLTALATAVAACVNPYGTRIWLYVAENTSSPSSRGLYEWSRTTITDACGVRLFVAVLVLGVLVARRKKLPARRDVPAMIAFTGLALTAIRHVVWTGMVLPIGLARLLAPAQAPVQEQDAAPQGDRRVHPALAVLFAVFWVFLLVKQSPWMKVRETGDAEVEARFSRETPAKLAAWAAENGVRGPLFNSMEWGGYLVWRLPETQVFVDARIWIFPDDVWNEYLGISGAAEGWEDALDRRGIQWAILEKRFHGGDLLDAIEASPRWERVYDDEVGAIYRRRVTAP